MNIAFIGHGNVGGALVRALARHGHRIVIGVRDGGSASADALASQLDAVSVLPAAQAVAGSEMVFLATPFQAVEDALSGLPLAGRLLVDCTNPVGPGLTHGLDSRMSGSEQLQQLLPDAKVLKAFTVYGFENFDDNRYPGYGELRPGMFFCGDDAAAKSILAGLLQELGWEPVDCGGLDTALQLEHMTLLWIKMARLRGDGSRFTWARLRR